MFNLNIVDCNLNTVDCNLNTVDCRLIPMFKSEPFLRTVDGEGNAAYEGFIKDLLDEISSVQGFTYDLVLSVDNKYGVQSGGNWSGLVGMLQREVVGCGKTCQEILILFCFRRLI